MTDDFGTACESKHPSFLHACFSSRSSDRGRASCHSADLRRATICNLLIPPCEGDGTKRYRKPCKAFEEVIKHGCGWELNMGDLSFAEPPDCYELPIRMGEEEAYADAAAIGADSTEADTEGRANDLTEIANVRPTPVLKSASTCTTQRIQRVYVRACARRADTLFSHGRFSRAQVSRSMRCTFY